MKTISDERILALTDRNSTYQITAADIYTPEQTEFSKEHYIPSVELQDFAKYAEAVIAEYPSEQFSLFYHNSHKVKAYPIVGERLEQTDLICYIFYDEARAFGYSMLRITPDGAIRKDAPPEFVYLAKGDIITETVEERAVKSVFDCEIYYPDFEITAIVMGANAGYVVGYEYGDIYMKLVEGEPKSFRRIAPFTTIEQGQNAYASYLDTQNRIISSIPIFPWETGSLPLHGYSSLVIMKPQEDALPVELYYEPDLTVAIPLLNFDLSENYYFLLLLYCRNQLIAEIVADHPSGTGKDSFTVISSVLSKRISKENYESLGISQYESIIAEAQACDEKWVCVGVAYNNGYYPVGYSPNGLSYFDAESGKLIELSK